MSFRDILQTKVHNKKSDVRKEELRIAPLKEAEIKEKAAACLPIVTDYIEEYAAVGRSRCELRFSYYYSKKGQCHFGIEELCKILYSDESGLKYAKDYEVAREVAIILSEEPYNLTVSFHLENVSGLSSEIAILNISWN